MSVRVSFGTETNNALRIKFKMGGLLYLITLNLFKLCPKELTLHQHFAVYSIYKCHCLGWKVCRMGIL